jgi:hypothetical protein
MCVGSKAMEFISSLLKDWKLCSVNVEGLLGRSVSRRSANFEPISTYALHELGRIFEIINLYGPYGGRKIFWEGLKYSSLMQGDDVILGGNFNLTLNQGEI